MSDSTHPAPPARVVKISKTLRLSPDACAILKRLAEVCGNESMAVDSLIRAEAKRQNFGGTKA